MWCSREPSVTSSVTFAEMTEESAVHSGRLSRLIEAQECRGVDYGGPEAYVLPGVNGSPLERDFSRGCGRSLRYKQTCLPVIKFLCSVILNNLRSTPTARRHAPGQPPYARDRTFAGAV